MGAERDIAWSFPDLQSVSGLEPSARLIDQGNQGDRNGKQSGGERGNPVLCRLRRRIEDIVPLQGDDPVVFVGRQRPA